MSDNYFAELYKIDVNEKTEDKGKLTYLSWTWAWAEVKKVHPEATYTIYENTEGWNYHTDGKTCWVKTGVTINEIEHIEYLPVMDYRNNSIPTDKVTSFDVNKAIQRSITKACARHGLGLYIYAGEDLPDDGSKTMSTANNISKRPTDKQTKAMEQGQQQMQEQMGKRITDEQLKQIRESQKQVNLTDAKIKQVYKVEQLEDLTDIDAINILKLIRKQMEKAG